MAKSPGIAPPGAPTGPKWAFLLFFWLFWAVYGFYTFNHTSYPPIFREMMLWNYYYFWNMGLQWYLGNLGGLGALQRALFSLFSKIFRRIMKSLKQFCIFFPKKFLWLHLRYRTRLLISRRSKKERRRGRGRRRKRKRRRKRRQKWRRIRRKKGTRPDTRHKMRLVRVWK